jgi:hypothetical protein
MSLWTIFTKENKLG